VAEKKAFNFLVDGGEVSAGPPIGSSLGPLGVNVLEVVNVLNQKTAEFKGMKVPVTVIIDLQTKQFEVSVGTPSAAALLVREAGVSKGSGKTKTEWVGNISMEQLVKIARAKMNDSYASTLKAAVKELLGTCLSLGLKVDGKEPKRVLQEVKEGRYDYILSA
jgi:large subunit ribosomal protein L11